jgi:ATP-dependent phosphofructokinase / diphosphate-dependent phosphofructokinase
MDTLRGALVVAQSGGPTAAINASLAGVVSRALREDGRITGVLGALHGIEGVLYEDLIDLGRQSPRTLGLLKGTPSSALGSCRHKLTGAEYERILGVFRAHDVRYFCYIGGNDSMDTAYQVGRLAAASSYELRAMGVPKTVDNDLAYTDHCPGYGSVARWIAAAVRDAGLDTEAIGVVDRVKVIECMGRDAGWITAAAALGRDHPDAAPHLIYLPERPVDMGQMLDSVQRVVDRLGYCVVAVCEGVKGPDGKTLVESTTSVDLDSFGHAQRGGVADYICKVVSGKLGLKARFDKPGTIQRVAGGFASQTDLDESFMAGEMAVQRALEGVSGKMITLERVTQAPYRCETGLADLDKVANAEKLMPAEFIAPSGCDVTQAFVDYAAPLIGGPLPEYAYLERIAVPRRTGS